MLFGVLLIGPLLVVSCGNVRLGQDWRTADRSATGIAPDPAVVQEAMVQVYAARAFNWRGMFAVHTWIATKAENAPTYTVHQVLGWRKRRGLPVVVSAPDESDQKDSHRKCHPHLHLQTSFGFALSSQFNPVRAH